MSYKLSDKLRSKICSDIVIIENINEIDLNGQKIPGTFFLEAHVVIDVNEEDLIKEIGDWVVKIVNINNFTHNEYKAKIFIDYVEFHIFPINLNLEYNNEYNNECKIEFSIDKYHREVSWKDWFYTEEDRMRFNI